MRPRVDEGDSGRVWDRARGELLAELEHSVLARNRRVYAIFDGALFDDLPAALEANRLDGHSLYRNVSDRALVRAGPWLIDPNVDVPHAMIDAEQAGTADDELQQTADRLASEMRSALESGDESGAGMLFMPNATPEIVASRLRTMIGLLADRPNAAVFWIGDDRLTADHLWRHARSLNRVMIPREHADEEWDRPIDEANGLRETVPTTPSGFVHDISHLDVMFRHADGNVIGEILPHLHEDQFRRVLGPAAGLVCIAPEHPSGRSGSLVRRASRPAGSVASATTLLRLHASQLDAIEEAQIEASRRETLAYLREHASEETATLDDEALYRRVVEIEELGFALGLETMAAHLMLAWLEIVAGPNAIDAEAFDAARREDGEHPDAAMEIAFDGFLDAAKNEADLEAW